jgi:SpoVK/Ycf46/Vps4 family AAA+-type ATPase
MENFKGILICATNFRTKMDHASIRRFNFKINFDYLSPAGKVKLFQHFFQIEKLTSAQIARLSRIPSLTPGDFKVVFQKNFFLDKSKADELLSELEQEVKYKNEVTKSMGLV